MNCSLEGIQYNVEMIDEDFVSSIPSAIFLAAEADQCHMYSHGCGI